MIRRLAKEGPLPISGLTRDAGVSRQGVTKHFRVLAQAGLVRDRRRGREHVFELERRPVERARRELDAIAARWDQALERLRRSVEE